MPTSTRWVSVRRIAEHLGVSTDTVYTWLTKQGLPAHRVGRLWKFDVDEVDAWVRRRTPQGVAVGGMRDARRDEETDSRWEQALSATTEFIFHVDLDDRIILVNRVPDGYERKSQLIGMSMREFAAPESRESYLRAFESVVREGKARTTEIVCNLARKRYVFQMYPVLLDGRITGLTVVSELIDPGR